MNLSFLRAEAEAPDRDAVVREGRAETFGSFLPRVYGAMARLLELGVRARTGGPEVVLAGSPTAETLAYLYALIELGVPFAPLHPRLTEWEKREIVRVCRPEIVWDEPPPIEPQEDDPLPGRDPLPDDGRPLAVVFTSGSTGRPKGVVLSRAAFVASARAGEANLGWRRDDRWALVMPLAHVGGLSIVTRSLLARRAVVLAAPFDAARLAVALERDRVTLLSAVPAMIRRLLDLDPLWRPPALLRAVLVGGGPVSRALLAEGAARGLPLLPTYGLTETCSQVATAPLGTTATDDAAPPLPGVEVREREGRLQVRGPMLMSGYFPPDAHASPFTDDGWLDTGDLGAIDESGRVVVHGRADDVVVTGGENVSLREVESAIEAFPGIASAVAFGVDDDTWGTIVAAAAAPEAGRSPDLAALRAFLAGRLAPHKTPRRLALLPSLPETPSGKKDRAAVRRAAEESPGGLAAF